MPLGNPREESPEVLKGETWLVREKLGLQGSDAPEKSGSPRLWLPQAEGEPRAPGWSPPSSLPGSFAPSFLSAGLRLPPSYSTLLSSSSLLLLW